MSALDTTHKTICGISVCNPVDIEEEYLNYTVDYAIEKGYDHIQFIGPIHNMIKGNIDGMALYHKYSQFNDEKDTEYVELATRVINEACEKTSKAGIKTYVWHHELELPNGFKEAFPQTLNEYGDIEVSSPEVRDFLTYKIIDFFAQYPKIDGIILTLHETKVPLLRLKNQKLDKIERVKLVTEILYNTCKSLGKELIVRPFASVAEDYEMMTNAYEQISEDMKIMDKWTQFDWSLCLPNNAFYEKIKKNPLFVETDIFGEFFGKGRLPLMLKEHIVSKYSYCQQYKPVGYCSRIDRAGAHPFGSANEVNLDIMHACLTGADVEQAIDDFFVKQYGTVAKEVRELMEHTEDILKKIIYLKGYYFSELSIFPKLNHCKNHFYFEMMKEQFEIASEEWYIPKNWERGTIESVIQEKEEAVRLSEELYSRLQEIKTELSAEKYQRLHTQFLNLKLCAHIWKQLLFVFLYYTKYFETKEDCYEQKLRQALAELLHYDQIGKNELGEEFYCAIGDSLSSMSVSFSHISSFVEEVQESFEAEKRTTLEFEKINTLCDYVICGGATEGHKLKKEVNFSNTFLIEGKLCRIPGSSKDWSTINGHGWFSYALKVKPGETNRICIDCGTDAPRFDLQITLGKEKTIIKEETTGNRVVEFSYRAAEEEDEVRIRFDRISEFTPFIYAIRVM